MAGLLLALSEMASARMQRRRLAWPIVAWSVAAFVFGFIVWLAAPKLGPQTARPDTSGVLINLSYAVQGLTYPLGPAARLAIDATGLSDQLVLWTLGVVFVAGAGFVARRGGTFRLFAYGAALWLVGALPFSVALVPGYVLAAAWLLYEQSIGAVLVWCAALIGFARVLGSDLPLRHQDTISENPSGGGSHAAEWLGGGSISLSGRVLRRLEVAPTNAPSPPARTARPADGGRLRGVVGAVFNRQPKFVPNLKYTLGVAAQLACFPKICKYQLRALASSWLAIFILVFSGWFIRTRIAYYERLSDAVWGLGKAMQTHPTDRSTLVVNFPRLARPAQRVFPIGVESPQFYARSANLHDVLAINGVDTPGDVHSLTFGNLIPPLDDSIETIGPPADWPDLAAAIGAVDRVYRVFFDAARYAPREAGRVLDAAPTDPLVRFGQSVALVNAGARLIEPHRLAVTLRWQYAGGADGALIFAHVVNGAGELIAQSDGPVMDMLPFWQWPTGKTVEEIRYITLPDSRDMLRVNVGVYDAATGERLAPIDWRGQTYPDGAATLFEINAGGAIHSLLSP
jgi:hypothetical protein